MLGDDVRELLGHRIPGDHARQIAAEHYAELWARRLRVRSDERARVVDLGCGPGDSVDLFRTLDPDVHWVGVDLERSPEVSARTRVDATA